MIRLDQDLIILNESGEIIPVYIEGDAPPVEELPDEYFTVSEDYTSNAVSADNKAREHLYEFTLKWYTKDASRLYTGLIGAIEQLISKGYDAEGNTAQNDDHNLRDQNRSNKVCDYGQHRIGHRANHEQLVFVKATQQFWHDKGNQHRRRKRKRAHQGCNHRVVEQIEAGELKHC